MSQAEIIARKRNDVGKKANRGLRGQNKIPAVLYGYKGSTLLELEEDKTRHALEAIEFPHKLLKIKVEDSETNEVTEHSVVLKDVQRHAYKEFLVHLDFQEMDPAQPMVAHVPLVLQGVQEATKQGGTIQMIVRDVPVSCSPDNIPDFIEIDVSKMTLNSYIRVSELDYPENVSSKAAQDYTIVTLRGRAAQQQDDAAEEAPAEEAAAEETA